MNKRETHKDITLSSRTWRVRKFDPLMGSFVATRLIGKIGTILAGVAAGAVNNEAAIATAVSEAIGSFPKAEFMELQLDALSVVGEVTTLPNGTPAVLPVKLSTGAWGVDGLEDDLLTVMALVTHSLVFNISPFFDGDALKSVMTSFQGLTLFNAST